MMEKKEEDEELQQNLMNNTRKGRVYLGLAIGFTLNGFTLALSQERTQKFSFIHCNCSSKEALQPLYRKVANLNLM